MSEGCTWTRVSHGGSGLENRCVYGLSVKVKNVRRFPSRTVSVGLKKLEEHLRYKWCRKSSWRLRESVGDASLHHFATDDRKSMARGNTMADGSLRKHVPSGLVIPEAIGRGEISSHFP
jgi:hypothetical protein